MGLLAFNRVLVQAFAADPIKTGHLFFYSAVKVLLCHREHIVQTVHLQISHTAALGTDKMAVQGSIPVEMIDTVTHLKSLYFSPVRQQRQIAIDGSQADFRKFLSDVLIDHVCGGMILARHQKVVDELPLSTVFHRHGNPP